MSPLSPALHSARSFSPKLPVPLSTFINWSGGKDRVQVTLWGAAPHRDSQLGGRGTGCQRAAGAVPRGTSQAVTRRWRWAPSPPPGHPPRPPFRSAAERAWRNRHPIGQRELQFPGIRGISREMQKVIQRFLPQGHMFLFCTTNPQTSLLASLIGIGQSASPLLLHFAPQPCLFSPVSGLVFSFFLLLFSHLLFPPSLLCTVHISHVIGPRIFTNLLYALVAPWFCFLKSISCIK